MRYFQKIPQYFKSACCTVKNTTVSTHRVLRYRRLCRKHRRRVRKNTPLYTRCKNCGHELKGMFCHRCGQYARDINPSVIAFVRQYFENSFQWDGKFFLTVRTLFTHPGKLSIAFAEGHVARYVFPLKLYMFVAVFFGFAIIALSNSSHSNTPDPKIIAQDSIIFQHIKAESTLDSVALKRVEYVLKSGVNTVDKTDSFTDSSFSNFKSRIPLIMMFAMPFFAVLTRLFYRRRYKRYIPHLIFSIHLHTAFFLMLIVLFSLILLFSSGDGWIISSLLLWFMVYGVIAAQRFFGTSWWGAILKNASVVFLYLIFCLIVFIAGLLINLWYDSLMSGVDFSTVINMKDSVDSVTVDL